MKIDSIERQSPDMMIGKGTMMYLVQLYKIKCVGLILAFLCAAVSVTGCAARDEAILLIPSEEAAEMEALEKAEQEADSAGNNEQPSDAKIPEPARQMIYVYVCGEVTNPGVVELEEGSRAGEALELAGGMTPAADPFYVNLAETVKDGQKLYFPTAEEAKKLETVAQAVEDGLVNINTASVEELCTLPGIGASRAADIVRYREKNGDFRTKEDIMKVSGIKQNAYDRLCDRITVS